MPFLRPSADREPVTRSDTGTGATPYGPSARSSTDATGTGNREPVLLAAAHPVRSRRAATPIHHGRGRGRAGAVDGGRPVVRQAVGPAAVRDLSTSSRAVPSGEPSPVFGSQPGAAA